MIIIMDKVAVIRCLSSVPFNSLVGEIILETSYGSELTSKNEC